MAGSGGYSARLLLDGTKVAFPLAGPRDTLEPFHFGFPV